MARDGVQAVELYEDAMKSHQKFDLIILDLTVPGGTGGIETINRLKQIDPQVKAIVSSGYSTDPVMADFSDYGFEEVVTKPYDAKQLAETVSRVLRG